MAGVSICPAYTVKKKEEEEEAGSCLPPLFKDTPRSASQSWCPAHAISRQVQPKKNRKH